MTTAAVSATPLSAFSGLPPHLVIDDAFGADLAARLLAFAVEREGDFASSMVGHSESKSAGVHQHIRRSRTIRDFGALRDDLEKAFLAMLPRALSHLGIAPFVPESLSLELAAHGDGDFYRRHIDTFVGATAPRTRRVVTGVYYFHAVPRIFTGGALRFHSILPVEQGGNCKDIEPANDRLLLFPAWVPHEVCPVQCPGGSFAQSRFAINCWYQGGAD
ncbi:2OG-Fe(II) oxygenase [Rhizorhabdus phycosphaerae]|uniref:2OG-Fe(II) oxygenase n=1 Tax=Rhizorhabdus phycosphaerae TaxID=2711156 RepID=UPI0013EE0053|nr:2OG-Fe(II) oxygenase [Rhizorhabdus phycosphaerae]